MDLRPEFQIQTVIKALSDVVLPALDPANKLAQEQMQLAIGTLHLVLKRAPLRYRYECHDLASLAALADTLQQRAADLPQAAPALAALAASNARSRDVLQRAQAEPLELEDANLELGDRVGAVVTAVSASAEGERLRAIQAAVLEHAREQLQRERAWLSPQGWEPGLPEVETLIRDAS